MTVRHSVEFYAFLALKLFSLSNATSSPKQLPTTAMSPTILLPTIVVMFPYPLPLLPPHDTHLPRPNFGVIVEHASGFFWTPHSWHQFLFCLTGRHPTLFAPVATLATIGSPGFTHTRPAENYASYFMHASRVFTNSARRRKILGVGRPSARINTQRDTAVSTKLPSSPHASWTQTM